MTKRHIESKQEQPSKKFKSLPVNELLSEFKIFKEEKSDQFGSGSTNMHFAAGFGSIELLLHFQREEVAVNNSDESQEIKLLQGTGSIFMTTNGAGMTPLHVAAYYGNLKVVRFLIEQESVNCDVQDKQGDTPLHLALQEGHIEVSKCLIIEGKSNCNIQNVYKETPLELASLINSSEAVRHLIVEGKANYNIQDEDGMTVLHYASREGKLEVVRCLILEGKANCDIQNEDGDTTLHFATEWRPLEVVKCLIVEGKADCDIQNDNGNTPLHAASEKGYPEIVKYLAKDAKADCNIQGQHNLTPLYLASVQGGLDVAKYYIESIGRDLTLLCTAPQEERLEVVKCLIEVTDDLTAVTTHGDRLLDLVVQSNNIELLKNLLKFGAPLHLAHPELVLSNKEICELFCDAQLADQLYINDFKLNTVMADNSVLIERYKYLLKKHGINTSFKNTLAYINTIDIPMALKDSLREILGELEAESSELLSRLASEMTFISKGFTLTSLKDFIILSKESCKELPPEISKIIDYYIQLDGSLSCLKEFLAAPSDFNQVDDMIRKIDCVNEKIILENLTQFLCHAGEGVIKLAQLKNIAIPVLMKEEVGRVVSKYIKFTHNEFGILQKNIIAIQQDQMKSIQHEIEKLKSITSQIMDKMRINVELNDNVDNSSNLIGNNDIIDHEYLA